MLDPKLIICDEPVSALDVSVQAQIINLLEDMKARYGLTLVFIAHDLAVVKNISDRVAVMYLGKLCEVGSPDLIYSRAGAPLHGGAARRDPRARPAQRGRRGARARAASCPRRSTRRAAAGSAPAARGPRPTAREAEPELREVDAGPVRRLPLPPRRHARRGPDHAGAGSAPVPAV